MKKLYIQVIAIIIASQVSALTYYLINGKKIFIELLIFVIVAFVIYYFISVKKLK